MKIAQIDVNFLNSSTGKIAADLFYGLIHRGHSVQAYFGRGDNLSINGVHKISHDLEVGLHAFGTRISGFTGCFSPLATKKLIKLLSEFKPDIVHLHDLHGYFININELVEYLKIEKIKTVWSFHSEFMYTGRCGMAIDCKNWMTNCTTCPDLKRYPETWFFDFASIMHSQKKSIFNNFDLLYLTAPSSWIMERMKISGIVNDKPMRIVPNGLNTDIFKPKNVVKLRNKHQLNDKKIVLSVGVNIFTNLKGGHWVLELASRNNDIVFIVIGSSSPNFNIPSNIIILPPIYDQMLLSEYYSLADFFLVTSVKETFSMVCAESLACGTPIIGFDSGGPSEIAPEMFGAFVAYGDIDNLNLLLRESIFGKRCFKSSVECSAHAVSKYSKEVMIDSFEKIYNQIMI